MCVGLMGVELIFCKGYSRQDEEVRGRLASNSMGGEAQSLLFCTGIFCNNPIDVKR
jgi:hypothetical protein